MTNPLRVVREGDRVQWTFTDTSRRKAVRGKIEGVVVGQASRGRIEVRSDDGALHHVQPSWVEVVDPDDHGPGCDGPLNCVCDKTAFV